MYHFDQHKQDNATSPDGHDADTSWLSRNIALLTCIVVASRLQVAVAAQLFLQLAMHVSALPEVPPELPSALKPFDSDSVFAHVRNEYPEGQVARDVQSSELHGAPATKCVVGA
jgi:hypothetical protein